MKASSCLMSFGHLFPRIMRERDSSLHIGTESTEAAGGYPLGLPISHHRIVGRGVLC